MIEATIIAMLVAKIKGYRLRPLFRSWEVYPGLIFVIMFMIMNSLIYMGNYYFVKFAGVFEKAYLFTFLILIIKHKLYNSAIIASVCVFIGTMLNKIAIYVNNGTMPVFPTLSYITGYAKPDSFIKVNDFHVLGNEATKLKSLTDVFDIGYSILSVGDIFIRLFVIIIIFNTLKSLNNAKLQNISL